MIFDVTIRHQTEGEDQIRPRAMSHATNERVANRHCVGRNVTTARPSGMARNSRGRAPERPLSSVAADRDSFRYRHLVDFSRSACPARIRCPEKCYAGRQHTARYDSRVIHMPLDANRQHRYERNAAANIAAEMVAVGDRVLVVGIAFLLILPYALAPLYRVIDPVSTLMLWRWAKRTRSRAHGGADWPHGVDPAPLRSRRRGRGVSAATTASISTNYGAW